MSVPETDSAEPVTRWMLEACGTRAGQRVLELASGRGDVGLRAADLVGQQGRVLISDGSEAAVDAARAHARTLGVRNARFCTLDMERIELPAESVDAVLCRWGLMLVAEPARALREMRRIVRPGGRVAVAVWDDMDFNPWSTVPALVLLERGLLPDASAAGGVFALAHAGRLADLMSTCGFSEVEVVPFDFQRYYRGFDAFWSAMLDLSAAQRAAFAAASPDTVGGARDAVEAALSRYRLADGALAIPARTLLASASVAG